MLQVARLAPRELHEACDRIVDFVRGQFNADGGVRDRDGKSDLYYTVFGLEALAALRADPPPEATRSFLEGFGRGEGLDLVHLACLARCWAALPNEAIDAETSDALLEHLERFRSADGGYGPSPGSSRGKAYHCFLACGAWQDLGASVPDPKGLIACLNGLHTADGGYSNEPAATSGTTPATAAAVTLLRNLGSPAPADAGEWLLRRAAPAGGFSASPEAPIPDLLSTATALHALAGMEISFRHGREAALDFVDTLWTGSGFCGNWSDDRADVEYTFYGLLALGHLSVA